MRARRAGNPDPRPDAIRRISPATGGVIVVCRVLACYDADDVI